MLCRQSVFLFPGEALLTQHSPSKHDLLVKTLLVWKRFLCDSLSPLVDSIFRESQHQPTENRSNDFSFRQHPRSPRNAAGPRLWVETQAERQRAGFRTRRPVGLDLHRCASTCTGLHPLHLPSKNFFRTPIKWYCSNVVLSPIHRMA